MALAELVRLKESGVHLIQGAGYYVDEYLPEDVKAKSVDELAGEMIAQVDDGCWGTSVRAGIIGEIGCIWPLRDFERKSLVAAALAQQATDASINVHPGRHADAPRGGSSTYPRGRGPRYAPSRTVRTSGTYVGNRLIGASLRALAHGADLVRDGLRYLRELARHGVPVHYGHALLRAEGTEAVERTVLVRLDRAGRPIRGSERRYEVDTVCLGYGFSPANELTRLLGCRHDWLPGPFPALAATSLRARCARWYGPAPGSSCVPPSARCAPARC